MKTDEYFAKIQDELFQIRNKTESGEFSSLDSLLRMRDAKSKSEDIINIVKEFEDDFIDEISSNIDKYGGKYKDLNIKIVNGRENFSFKNIDKINILEKEKKELEDKYKNAFKGFQKGVVQTTRVDDLFYWIDENGELNLFPDISIGKCYIKIDARGKHL